MPSEPFTPRERRLGVLEAHASRGVDQLLDARHRRFGLGGRDDRPYRDDLQRDGRRQRRKGTAHGTPVDPVAGTCLGDAYRVAVEHDIGVPPRGPEPAVEPVAQLGRGDRPELVAKLDTRPIPQAEPCEDTPRRPALAGCIDRLVDARRRTKLPAGRRRDAVRPDQPDPPVAPPGGGTLDRFPGVLLARSPNCDPADGRAPWQRAALSEGDRAERGGQQHGDGGDDSRRDEGSARTSTRPPGGRDEQAGHRTGDGSGRPGGRR
jgi:hypothetical protein